MPAHTWLLANTATAVALLPMLALKLLSLIATYINSSSNSQWAYSAALRAAASVQCSGISQQRVGPYCHFDVSPKPGK
jgi:hypothetical protein